MLAKLRLLPKTLLALLLSVAIVGLSVGISKLFAGAMAQAVIIIAITTLGVLAFYSFYSCLAQQLSSGHVFDFNFLFRLRHHGGYQYFP